MKDNVSSIFCTPKSLGCWILKLKFLYNPWVLLTTFVAIHLLITIFTVDYHLMNGQDYNYVHAFDVWQNPENWEHDVEGSFDRNPYFVFSTLNMWLPTVLHKITRIPLIWMFRLEFFLKPIVLLILLILILRYFGFGNVAVSTGVLLFAFYNFQIISINLASYGVGIYNNYYGVNYFIVFFLALYAHLRKKIIVTYSLLAIGIFLHPIFGFQGLLFFAILSVAEKVDRKKVGIGFAITGASLLAERYILSRVLRGVQRIDHSTWWNIFQLNGHLNFPMKFPELFVFYFVALFLFTFCIWPHLESPKIKLMLKSAWGLLFFALLSYCLGYILQNHVILKLGLLRSSIFVIFTFIIALGTLNISKDKWRETTIGIPLFLVLLILLFHTSSLKVGIISVVTIAICFCLLRRLNLAMYLFLIASFLVCPVMKSVKVYHKNREVVQLVQFVRENVPKEKVFLFWGGSPRGHIFRTLTKCQVIDPRRMGLAIYDESESRYKDELHKLECAGIDTSTIDSMTEVFRIANQKIEATYPEETILENFELGYSVDFLIIGKRLLPQEIHSMYENEKYAIIKINVSP
ncbi:hypothetical protein ES702_01351 [subsurface metagenome]